MIVSALAPAKINLGLEILGRRPDGYHEIRTVMASVSLFDRLQARASDLVQVDIERANFETGENLVLRAVRTVARTFPNCTPHMTVRKRIPAAAGLGGASSDAAATFLMIDRLYGLNQSHAALQTQGAALGSDIPYFFTGGLALVEGRGERVTPLMTSVDGWVVIVVPHVRIPAKTATLYKRLDSRDFSDGSTIAQILEGTSFDQADAQNLLVNAFERPLYEIAPSLSQLGAVMRHCGARSVAISGAGPAHYALESDVERAHAIGSALRGALNSRAAVHVGRVTQHGVLLSEAEAGYKRSR